MPVNIPNATSNTMDAFALRMEVTNEIINEIATMAPVVREQLGEASFPAETVLQYHTAVKMLQVLKDQMVVQQMWGKL